MNQTTEPLTLHEAACSQVPIQPAICALNSFHDHFNYPSNLEGTTLDFRRLLFLHWVAYERRFEHEISLAERLTCPILWCRLGFTDSDGLLAHVVKCKHIASGEYWCPRHLRGEIFSKPPPDTITDSKNHTNRSNFFRRKAQRLVRKITDISRSSILKISGAPPFDPFDTYVAYDIELEESCIYELDSDSRGSESLGAVHWEKRHELPNTSGTVGDILTEHPRNHEMLYPLSESELDQIFGLDSVSQPLGEANTAGSVEMRDSPWLSGSPISPISFSPVLCPFNVQAAENSTHTWTSFETDADRIEVDRISPPSGNPTSSLIHSQYQQTMVRDKQVEWQRGDHNSSMTQPSYEEFVDVTSMNDSTGNISSTNLVNDLAVVSTILHKQICAKLSHMPTIVPRNMFQSALPKGYSILHSGVQVLRTLCQSGTLSSATELHSLLHLACACAIISNEYSIEEVFDRISANIQTCGRAIQFNKERELYFLVSEWIWKAKLDNNNHPRGSRNNSSQYNDICAQPSSDDSGRRTASNAALETDVHCQTLWESWPVQVCRRFLAVIEYSQLLEGPRGAILQARHDSADQVAQTGPSKIPAAWSEVLRGLIGEFGLEGFDPVVRNIACMIHKGAFMNPREVELKLLYDGRLHTRDSRKFRCFLRLVNHFCELMNSNCKSTINTDAACLRSIDYLLGLLSNSHTTDLKPTAQSIENDDMIISTSDLGGSAGLKSTSSTGSNRSIKSVKSLCLSLSSGSRVSKSSSVSSSRVVSRLQSLKSFYIEAEFSENTTHQRTFSNSSAKKSADTDRKSTHNSLSGVLQCLVCDRTFQGHGRYQKANLQRHMKTQHAKRRPRFRCSMCSKQFNRVDNLRAHQRLAHNGSGRSHREVEARITITEPI